MTTAQMTHEQLQQKCLKQEQQIADLTAKLTWLEEQYRLSRKKQFGHSSEQTHPDQLSIFNEAEVEATSAPEPTIEQITYRRRKREGQREEKLENLPVEVIEYFLPAEEQVCSCCGGDMHEMSTEVRQEIKIVPAVHKVVKHVRHIYSCRKCERENMSTPIMTAPMPAPVLPGSLASPSAIAHIMSQKYVEGMPLYRQEQQFSREGLELSRQTMSNWVVQSTERWLAPVFERMHMHLLRQDVLHADETTLQVLHESGRAAESQSCMWMYRTGRGCPPIVLYEYQATKGRKHPIKFLDGFKGYLHVDGNPVYNSIPGVTLAGCWAHARRGYTEALAALPKGAETSHLVTQQGLDFCNKLFMIERQTQDMTPEERHAYRLEHSHPVLTAFSAWLNHYKPSSLPKGLLGRAITYCHNQLNKLQTFLKDGRLELDNNRAERAIKPFVIGRKNFLFSNTPRGARSSAIVYSLVETAKENKLNPRAYLEFLFEQLPNMDLKNTNNIDALLPWSQSLPAEVKVKAGN